MKKLGVTAASKPKPEPKAFIAAEHQPRLKAALHCLNTFKYPASIKAFANCEKFLIEVPPTKAEDYETFYKLLLEVYNGLGEAFAGNADSE